MGITRVILRDVKTAVSIPDRIFEAGERLAKRLGMSRSELYSKAVSEFVEAREEKNITRELDRVYGEEDSSVDSLLEQLQAASLPREEW